jgi:hypothetical protein
MLPYQILGEFAISTVKHVYRTVTDICYSYSWNEPVFLEACQKGDLELVQRYLRKKGLTSVNKGLIVAVAYHANTVARYLLARGANNIEQAMEASIKAFNQDMIRHIRKDVSEIDRYVTYMCENNMVNSLTVFLEEPCDIKILNRGLKMACEKCYYSLAELLVQKGASTSIGIKYATSGNILKMCYRHEQKSENIN